MRHSSTLLLLGLVALGVCATPYVPEELYSPLIPRKVLDTFNALPDPIQYPQYTTTSGKWRYFSPDKAWTSGFFPATLYALNSRQKVCPANGENQLGIANWIDLGRSTSAGLVPLEDGNRRNHSDQGFISLPFAEELNINPDNTTAQTAIKAFSENLAARFSPVVGCTKSWDNAEDPTVFEVLIENMMNLELLFHAADLTGNSTLRDIAMTHADTTIQNHIRDDGESKIRSTWQIIVYNSTTGDVIRKRTGQGYSDDSTWSRGQALGIYSFANMYRLTNKHSYLVTARRLAKYFLDNIPNDGIVPWDFNAPLIPAPRPADSSAATVAAMGLLLLAQVETNEFYAKYYTNSAINITNAIVTLAWNEPWESLLSNGTVDKRSNNALTGTTYGDYYYIKVGTELISRGLATCT